MSHIRAATYFGLSCPFSFIALLAFHQPLAAAPIGEACPDRLQAPLIECGPSSHSFLCEISLEGPWNQASQRELQGLVAATLHLPVSISEGDYVGYAIWGGPDNYYESETLLGAGAIRIVDSALGNILGTTNLREVHLSFPVWEVGAYEVQNVSLAVLYRSQRGDRRFYLQQACVMISGTGVLTGNGLNWEAKPGQVQTIKPSDVPQSVPPPATMATSSKAFCSLRPISGPYLKGWLWIVFSFCFVLLSLRRARPH